MGRGRAREGHPLLRVGRGGRAREGVSARRGGPGEREKWGPAGAGMGASMPIAASSIVLAGLLSIYNVINVMQMEEARHVLRLNTRASGASLYMVAKREQMQAH